jgi:hypothetical protein
MTSVNRIEPRSPGGAPRSLAHRAEQFAQIDPHDARTWTRQFDRFDFTGATGSSRETNERAKRLQADYQPPISAALDQPVSSTLPYPSWDFAASVVLLFEVKLDRNTRRVVVEGRAGAVRQRASEATRVICPSRPPE